MLMTGAGDPLPVFGLQWFVYCAVPKSFQSGKLLTGRALIFAIPAICVGATVKTLNKHLMNSAFNGKTSNGARSSDYDFLNGVFEWVFYSLPPRADNTFIRNMFEFYKTRGGLSKKQLEALLRTINGIGSTPPFSAATLEAIIKKKASKTKSSLPPVTPMYKEDNETREKLDHILATAPAHKGALLYMNKLNLHQPLSQADKDAIHKFYTLINAAKKK